jgi:hypothetical protein|nr:MAG TPA: hypothetical protein [Caudoviricetes sp.]
MEKINISQKDFNSLVLEVFRAHYKYDGNYEESIKAALKEKIFNIKKEFDENSWNDCDVEPPEKYDCEDVIIRRKSSVLHNSSTGHTCNCCAYYIGYYDSETSPHFHEQNDLTILDKENLSEFEYKFIK